MKRQPFAIIGYILFGLYILQYFLPKWEYLMTLQQYQPYKRWSGLLLFSVIIFQWILTLVRMTKSNSVTLSKNILQWHQWLGALSPVFFYFHSMEIGIGYLLVLSLLYYGNFLLGLLNITIVKTMGKKVFKVWYLSHIVASLLIFIISGFHIWMVFYYE